MSDVVIAIILGVVEGLTEYLPISSTGHLILFGEALHFTGEKAKTFDVVIQLGAILSVLVLYRHRFVALFKGLRQGVSKPRTALNPGIQGILKLALVSAPALSVGFIFRGQIKEHLFAPFPVAIAFAVGALLILIVDRNGKVEGQIEIDQLTCRQSFLIGCVQCLALWPGMSRSASTIIGGMLGGLSRAAAAEFSFLAAVPVLSAAALYDLSKALLIFTTKDLELVAIGFVISFVTALIAIKVFISIVSRWSLRPFAYYRLLVAAIVLTLL